MDNEKFGGLYIGPKKIKSAMTSANHTYLGKEKIIIKYEDETEEEFPTDAISYVITKEKSDLTTLCEKRVTPIAEKILEVLAESELKKEDMEYLINNILPASIDESLRKANKILWGGKEFHEVTLTDIDRVLRKNNGGTKGGGKRKSE